MFKAQNKATQCFHGMFKPGIKYLRTAVNRKWNKIFNNIKTTILITQMGHVENKSVITLMKG